MGIVECVQLAAKEVVRLLRQKALVLQLQEGWKGWTGQMIETSDKER